jgi:antirestriction protein ArdC
MSPSAARARAGRVRTSLYQEITDKIIAELEAGRVPWVQPWGTAAAKAPLGMPKNAATQRRYSGVNVLILWGAVIERGFSAQSWVTFRQTLRLGGNVRKGELGTAVVYADRFTPDEERRRAERDGDEANAIAFLKRFTVFNTDQCDNLPEALRTSPPPVPEGLILPHAEALIVATGADFRIGGERAFYIPSHDFIQVPRPDVYFQPINWHRTALHELGHWSGHPSRLGRDLSGGFGSALYAKEELIAEITSAFVCASLGIVPTVRHADYVGCWLEVLREDDRAIVRAASAASKAADYLLAFRHDPNDLVDVIRTSDSLHANATERPPLNRIVDKATA